MNASTRERVLIVENELNIRLVLRLTLEREYEIREAIDGQEALAILAEWRPRVAIVDIDMPRLDGIELCRRLKAEPSTRDIVVLLVTGYTQRTDREAAEAAGADGFLTKPFSPARLAREIQAALGR